MTAWKPLAPVAPDAKCANCFHIKDLHQRYVRNLNCCYDCHCKRFERQP